MTPDDLRLIEIELDIDGARALQLSMAADGGVRRRGDGAGPAPPDLQQGRIDPAAFARVAAVVTADWPGRPGRYTDPSPRGRPCRLHVVLSPADGPPQALEFRYGSQSLGPPAALTALVEAAVGETDDWYAPLAPPPPP